MKTNHVATRYSTLIAVMAFLLSTSSLRAQTYMGKEKLSGSPMSFEAIAYPITNGPAAIRVNFNNQTAGSVRVTIRDEKGNRVYEQFEKTAAYRSRLDLSLLPAGNYTLDLSKEDDHFIRTFTIEPPTAGHITMGTQPVQKPYESPVDKKLIVSH